MYSFFWNLRALLAFSFSLIAAFNSDKEKNCSFRRAAEIHMDIFQQILQHSVYPWASGLLPERWLDYNALPSHDMWYSKQWYISRSLHDLLQLCSYRRPSLV